MTILSHFNSLVAQTEDSLSDLDSYDLDSADPASAEHFKALELAYREDARALVDFVATNRITIIAALN
jgi:hypothetical protein